MLDVPEYVKQRCRGNGDPEECIRHLDMAFFASGIDTLYPSNDLYPENDLYPSEAGVPWLEINLEKVSMGSLTLTEKLCSADDIILGSCEAAKIEIIVADIEEDLTGKEFALTLSIGDYKMAFGMYTIASMPRQADRRKRKITAYDRMLRFDMDVADWYTALYSSDGSAHTLKELRDSLCQYCNVPQQETALANDNLTIGKTISPQTLNGRDVLRAICEINGVFGHIDRTGQLVYVKLQESGLYPSETLYPSEDLYPHSAWRDVAEELEYYKTITYEDYMTEGIDRVQIRQEEGDIGATVGWGTNTYVIEGNFLTYGLASAELTRLAQSVVDMIGGRGYRPAKIETYAMPWVEVGDGIRAVTTQDEITTYVLSRTIKGIQAMMDTVESKGSQTRGELSGGIQSEIIQLKGKTATIIKSVDEVSVKLSDVEKNTAASIKVVSDQITAEVKRATGQEVELAASIKVMAGQIEQKVSQGDLIAKFNMEVNKDGSVITMEAGHFVFKGKNFYVNADGSGGAANGNFTWDTAGNITVTKATINGTTNTSSFGASVVNADHLEAGRIVCNGNSQFSGRITAMNIDCNKIDCVSVYSSMAGETWSDQRLKEDIHKIDPRQAVRFLTDISSVSYRLKANGEPALGFLAQDVREKLRRMGLDYPLVGEHNGYLTLRYQDFVPLLVAAVQELIKKRGEHK